MFVLAMDFHQQRRQLAKLARVGRAPVDPCLGAALGADDPAQLALAIFVQLLARQPLARFRQFGEVKLCCEVGPIAAGTHHAAVGTCAGQQHERVDQQRLARARFAADHSQARAESDLGSLDDRKMTNVKRSEHGQNDDVIEGL